MLREFRYNDDNEGRDITMSETPLSPQRAATFLAILGGLGSHDAPAADSNQPLVLPHAGEWAAGPDAHTGIVGRMLAHLPGIQAGGPKNLIPRLKKAGFTARELAQSGLLYAIVETTEDRKSFDALLEDGQIDELNTHGLQIEPCDNEDMARYGIEDADPDDERAVTVSLRITGVDIGEEHAAMQMLAKLDTHSQLAVDRAALEELAAKASPRAPAPAVMADGKGGR